MHHAKFGNILIGQQQRLALKLDLLLHFSLLVNNELAEQFFVYVGTDSRPRHPS